MKVQDVMTKDPAFCRDRETLATAAGLMRARDCGAIPVVGEDHRVVGIITDRDICLAAAAAAEQQQQQQQQQNARLSALKAGDFTGEKLVSCQPSDRLKDALKKMGKNQIKRLPVTSREGHLVGIITFADIVLAAEKRKSLKKSVFSALKKISKPAPILLREIVR